MGIVDFHEQTLRRSVQIAKASEFLFPRWRFISPFEVMRRLDRERIRFVLVGSFGLCGWRKQTRAAGYAEVLVGRTVWQKAVAALGDILPKIWVCNLGESVELRQPATGKTAVKVVWPLRHPYSEVIKNSELIHGKRGSYRIPDLEMALTLAFADMTGEGRCWADRYQAAHDFICIVKANEGIDEKKLLRLASLISSESVRDIAVRIKRIRHGEKIGDLTLGA
ncbi:MAG: hypothetical protein HY289_11865 [Planctomycetes bacterium]|nr:hypothetical protein [Planctomycetota bacterium]